MCRIWFCPLLPQGSCPMLSRSSRPNFNSWSQRTAFCFDVQIHKTLQLGFRYLHSSASPSYNPHTLEYLKIWLESLCKFRTPSLVTIMRGYKESLCLLPQDVHIFHHLTHQTVPEDFCKAHLRNQMQQKSQGEPLKHRQRMASVPSPSSVTTAQGLEHTHGSCYPFCLVRQFNLYPESSLFIKLEKRQRHEPEPIHSG